MEEKETLLHRVLPDVVERVLAPISENHPALRERLKGAGLAEMAAKVALQLKPAAAGRGIKLEGNEYRDAIESEIRHQAEAILQGSEGKKHKIAEFSRFLKEDISSAMRDAFETALELHARNHAAVEKIATEASLSINQLLAQAKKEFNLRNPHSPAHNLDPEVCEALTKRIDKLDAHYALPTITDMLCEKLGITYIDQLRERLQQNILSATAHFQEAGAPEKEIPAHTETLQALCQKEVDEARAKLEEAFPREDVRAQVTADLDALANLYTDAENLSAKFAPFVSP